MKELTEKDFTSDVESKRLSSEEFKDIDGQPVFPSQIWRDGQLIPSEAPTLSAFVMESTELGEFQYATYSIEYASKTVSILKKYIKLPLYRVKGTDNCFYHENLVNIIPYNFDSTSHTYNWQIFVNGRDLALDYGVGGVLVDMASGVLSFDEDFIKKNPITSVFITFYQYTGRKGFFGATLNEDLPFSDSESLLYKEDDPTWEASLKVRGDKGISKYILPPVKASYYEKGNSDTDCGVFVLQETLNAVIDKIGIVNCGVYL